MREAEQAVNENCALVVGHLELGSKQIGIDVVVGAVLAVIAAVHVSRDAKSRREPEGRHALPTVLVDSACALAGIEAGIGISAEYVQLVRRRLLRKQRDARGKLKETCKQSFPHGPISSSGEQRFVRADFSPG